MTVVKLTKNELRKQKDALKMYIRYLPTLMLKKQQLQMEIMKVEQREAQVREKRDQMESDLEKWVAVLGEDIGFGAEFFKTEELLVEEGNVAGVRIPVFKGARFAPASWDLWSMPLWVDKAVVEIQKILLLDFELDVLEQQRARLFHELRTTTQRVNLFEKVKIPETKGHIKRISIYLGDQQTAAVVCGKIAKKGLEKLAS